MIWKRLGAPEATSWCFPGPARPDVVLPQRRQRHLQKGVFAGSQVSSCLIPVRYQGRFFGILPYLNPSTPRLALQDKERKMITTFFNKGSRYLYSALDSSIITVCGLCSSSRSYEKIKDDGVDSTGHRQVYDVNNWGI